VNAARPDSSPKLASSAAVQSALGARAALALCGFSAVVGQIVLMRELIQVFNGNEIALGILLATWLLWTAAGSGLSSAVGLGRNRPRLAVAALECVLAASLPATIWALRGAKVLFQTVPGELVGPVPMLFTSLVCLSVFCAASGAVFVAAARMAEAESGLSPRAAASSAYLLEAAGSALGGILASVVLLRFCDAFQIAAIAGLLNLCVAIALLLRLRRAPLVLLACAAALAAVPLLIWVAPRCDAAARARLWRGFNVVAARETIYGNLTVTETGPIRSIYENGAILANAPDPAAAEEAVDYALLEHAAPRRVLLIGGGVNGGVAEALKHPTVASLDYVELDPALIGMARRFFSSQTADFDSDPRVHLHLVDGRRYLTETKEKFDVIIVDVPDPQTAQLNRFYTAEFYRLARAHLEPGGLLAAELRSSEETISPDLAEFLRSIRRTLGEVFPYQAAIPGETIHFFGAIEPGVLTRDPQVLVARLRERRLATQYVREYFIPYRMMPDRMDQVETELAPAATTPVNRDFAPIAYAFDVVLWSAQFKSGYADWFRAAEHVAFGRVAGALAIALLLCVGLMAFLPGRERRERAAAGSCVAATGFTLMALQIFLLLGFQAVYGYVYTELATLIGLFMAGIALGSWLAMRRANAEERLAPGFVSGHDRGTHPVGGSRAAKQTGALAPEGSFDRLSLPAVQLLLALACPALLLVVSLIGSLASSAAAWVAAQILFPALAALAGILGGYQFVVAAGIFLRGRGERLGLGVLYAIDLLGGCAGALALSGFLIPVFGFWKTAWLAAAINAAAVLLAARANLVEQNAARKLAALGGIAPNFPDVPRRKMNEGDPKL
jgi:spermidine synthase